MNFLPRLCALVCLLATPWPASAEGVGQGTDSVDWSAPLTLETAIRAALVHQPTIAIARSQVDSSKARVSGSMSSYYPQVAPYAEYSHQRSNLGSFGMQTQDDTTTQLVLRQTLYDAGRREANLALSRVSASSADLGLKDARQSVILNVTVSYFEVLRRRELVRVQESSVERARATLDETREAVAAGAKRRIDILQAGADHDNALVQLSQARNDVALAQTTLKNAIGVRTPVVLVLPDTAVEKPATAVQAETAAKFLDTAFASRLDLQRDALDVTISKHSLQLAAIDAGPQVQADVTQLYRFSPDRVENRSLIASLSYPLFDGGLSRSRVRQAKAALDQSRLQLELAKQAIQLDVEQAYLLRGEARERHMAAQNAVRATQASYEAASSSYKEGAGTIIDVITSRSQLVIAETSLVQSIFDFHTADARLKRAVGGNDPYTSVGGKP